MAQNPAQSLVKLNLESALNNAIEIWAERQTRIESYEREGRICDKVAMVSRFFAFIGKHPGAVTPPDVQRWRESLEAQEQKPATVYARLSLLSSFYKWLISNPQIAAQIPFNPVPQARPRYPRPYGSESVKAWSDEEAGALLAAVKSPADGRSLVGKGDYALLLLYLYTGLRRNEVIGLRGKDLAERGGELVVKYRRKSGKYVGRAVGEPDVYAALKDYLNASGRMDALGSERPLWTRHDRAGRAGAPMSSRSFVENLKKYGRAAGPGEIHLHQSRHTYARMIAEDTGSFLETQEALDHENAATTRVYVQRITVKADRFSGRIAKRLERPPGA